MKYMEDNKTFAQFLLEEHYNTSQQSFAMREIFGYHSLLHPEEEVDGLIDKFPNFWFGESEETGVKLNFRKMFMDRYDIRKIGQDTNQLFIHFLREKMNELLVKYAPKMQKWLENFNELFKFTVKLERDDTGYLTNGNQNTYYLNPTTATATNLKVQDVDKSDRRIDRNLHTERDVLQSVWGKTRADIMEKIMDLKDIFNDCLDAFEVIFSVVI